jgi:cytochrome c biogenesis protein CcdA
VILRLAGIAFAVGLADSINPSTIGPALYLATGRRPVVRVTLFAAGVFAVNVVAGVALTLGPGRLLIGLVPHPRDTVKYVLEVLAGVLLIAVAIALWRGRRSLARRELPLREGGGGSAFITGASIAAVEFPTALPYFAVIAAIAASSAGPLQVIGLLTLYAVGFVLPLLAIVVILLVVGERADPWLLKAGVWLQQRWPVVLAALLLLVGGALTVIGGVGLVR